MIKNLRPPSTQSFMARTSVFIEASTNEKLVPVSNSTLLKNPANNMTEPMPEHGLRPLRRVGDIYGNYIVTTELKAVPVSNRNLLQAKRCNPTTGAFIMRKSEPMPVPTNLSKEYRKLLNFNILPEGYALNKGPKKIELAFLEKLTNDNAKRVVLEFMNNSVAGSIYRPLRIKHGDTEKNAQAKEAYDSALQEMLGLFQRGITQGSSIDLTINKFMGQLRRIYNTAGFNIDTYVNPKDIEESINKLMGNCYGQQQENLFDREDPNGIAPRDVAMASLTNQLPSKRAVNDPQATLAAVTAPLNLTGQTVIAADTPQLPGQNVQPDAQAKLDQLNSEGKSSDVPQRRKVFTAADWEEAAASESSDPGNVFLGTFGSPSSSRKSSIGGDLTEEQQNKIADIEAKLTPMLDNSHLDQIFDAGSTIIIPVKDPVVIQELINRVSEVNKQIKDPKKIDKLYELDRALNVKYERLVGVQSESKIPSKLPSKAQFSEGDRPIGPFKPLLPATPPPAAAEPPVEEPIVYPKNEINFVVNNIKKQSNESDVQYNARTKPIYEKYYNIIYSLNDENIRKVYDIVGTLYFLKENAKNAQENIKNGKLIDEILSMNSSLLGKYTQTNYNDNKMDRTDEDGNFVPLNDNDFKDLTQKSIRDTAEPVAITLETSNDPATNRLGKTLLVGSVPDDLKGFTYFIPRMYPKGIYDPRIQKILNATLPASAQAPIPASYEKKPQSAVPTPKSSEKKPPSAAAEDPYANVSPKQSSSDLQDIIETVIESEPKDLPRALDVQLKMIRDKKIIKAVTISITDNGFKSNYISGKSKESRSDILTEIRRAAARRLREIEAENAILGQQKPQTPAASEKKPPSAAASEEIKDVKDINEVRDPQDLRDYLEISLISNGSKPLLSTKIFEADLSFVNDTKLLRETSKLIREKGFNDNMLNAKSKKVLDNYKTKIAVAISNRLEQIQDEQSEENKKSILAASKSAASKSSSPNLSEELDKSLVSSEEELPSTSTEEIAKDYAIKSLTDDEDRIKFNSALTSKIRDVGILKKRGTILAPYNLPVINNILNNPKFNTEKKLEEINFITTTLSNIISKDGNKLSSPDASKILSINLRNKEKTPEEQLNFKYLYIMRYMFALYENGIIDYVPLQNVKNAGITRSGKGRKSRKSKKEPLPKLEVTDEEYKKSTKKLLKREKGKRAFQELLEQPPIKRGATRFSTDELNQIINSILSSPL